MRPFHDRSPPLLVAGALALVWVAALLPAVPLLEFSGGMENANVATALETVREGHWLIPHLNGEPRTRKPPLATWITATGIWLTGSLVWGARLPNVLCSGLLVGATYLLGRRVVDHRVGLIAALIAGSSILFLAHAVPAQYDMPFAVCVTLAHVSLAGMVFEGRWWRGWVGAGLWIGLACLVKGPLVFLLTLVPWVLYLPWATRGEVAGTTPPVSGTSRWGAPVVGVLILVLVTLPWTLVFLSHVPDAWRIWISQSLQMTERRTESHPWWWKYVLVLPWFGPWTLWYVAALAGLLVDRWRPGRRRMVLMVLLVWVPLVVMSFSPLRRMRYVVPLAAPLAILAAWRLAQHFERPHPWPLADRVLAAAHLVLVAVLAVGVPIAGVWFLQTADGQPWYAAGLGLACAAGAAGTIAVALVRWRNWRWHVGATAALMLVLHSVFLLGYRDTPSGRSSTRPMAQRLLALYPDAIVYNAHPEAGRDAPLELSIYLGRPLWRSPDPAAIPRMDRPQIILVPGGPGGPPAIPGFRLIDQTAGGGDEDDHARGRWYALLRE